MMIIRINFELIKNNNNNKNHFYVTQQHPLDLTLRSRALYKAIINNMNSHSKLYVLTSLS